MYFVVLYTGLVQDPEVLYTIGWVHIGHILFLVLSNFAVIIGVNFVDCKQKNRLNSLRKQQKKLVEEKRLHRETIKKLREIKKKANQEKKALKSKVSESGLSVIREDSDALMLESESNLKS